MGGDRDTRALIVFFGLLAVLSTATYVPIIQAGNLSALGGNAVLYLMWAPGVAGILTSLICYRSLRPLGFGLSRASAKWLAICFVLPFLYTLVVQGTLWTLGAVELGSRNLTFLYFALGPLVSLKTATGEEIGWRGFAAPLCGAKWGFFKGNLLLGFIWGVYHLPAIFFAGYGDNATLLGVACFFVSVMSLSLFLGHVRERSGTLWTAALMHAIHNMVFLHLFDPMRVVDAKKVELLGGEMGILLAVIMLCIAAWTTFARGAFAQKRVVSPPGRAPSFTAG